MAVSIEELDATVRAFYEGRGEQVRPLPRSIYFSLALLIFNPANLAKSRPGSSEPGKCFFTRPFAISYTNHLPLT